MPIEQIYSLSYLKKTNVTLSSRDLHGKSNEELQIPDDREMMYDCSDESTPISLIFSI